MEFGDVKNLLKLSVCSGEHSVDNLEITCEIFGATQTTLFVDVESSLSSLLSLPCGKEKISITFTC